MRSLNDTPYYFSYYIILLFVSMSILDGRSDRVNNFWEKSSAVIEGFELGAGLEQDGSAGELAVGQACGSMLVLEDAPIVISAEGSIDLLPNPWKCTGFIVLCLFGSEVSIPSVTVTRGTKALFLGRR